MLASELPFIRDRASVYLPCAYLRLCMIFKMDQYQAASARSPYAGKALPSGRSIDINASERPRFPRIFAGFTAYCVEFQTTDSYDAGESSAPRRGVERSEVLCVEACIEWSILCRRCLCSAQGLIRTILARSDRPLAEGNDRPDRALRLLQ